jgi:hypothetical protein
MRGLKAMSGGVLGAKIYSGRSKYDQLSHSTGKIGQPPRPKRLFPVADFTKLKDVSPNNPEAP